MSVKVFRADEPECGYAPPDGTMLLAYRGSVAHNMYVPKNDPKHIDDIDLIGFVFGSVENYLGLKEWGSRGTQEVKDGPYDVVLYEMVLALIGLIAIVFGAGWVIWWLIQHVRFV